MKKLFFLLALLFLTSVSFAHYGDVSSEGREVIWVIKEILPFVIPIVLFVAGTFIAIFVTRSIVNANAKTKIAKYEMLKRYAETGAQLPKEFQNEIHQDFVNEKPRLQKTKEGTMLTTLTVLFFAMAALMLLRVNNFGNDLAEFVIGLIMLGGGGICLWMNYKITVNTKCDCRKDVEQQNNEGNSY